MCQPQGLHGGRYNAKTAAYRNMQAAGYPLDRKTVAYLKHVDQNNAWNKLNRHRVLMYKADYRERQYRLYGGDPWKNGDAHFRYQDAKAHKRQQQRALREQRREATNMTVSVVDEINATFTEYKGGTCLACWYAGWNCQRQRVHVYDDVKKEREWDLREAKDQLDYAVA